MENKSGFMVSTLPSVRFGDFDTACEFAQSIDHQEPVYIYRVEAIAKVIGNEIELNEEKWQ